MSEFGIRLIAGIGNPGDKYKNNRHNVGFRFVDYLARKHTADFITQSKFHADVCRIETAGGLLWLFKPGLFVNRSGQPLSKFINYHKIPLRQVLVVHDEIDFAVAKIRLKRGGGTGGHNGLVDIVRCLGAEFWRLRIGVGHPGTSARVPGYVLADPAKQEAELIDDTIFRGGGELDYLVAGEFQAAMKHLHSEGGEDGV